MPTFLVRVRDWPASHLNVGIKVETWQQVLPFSEC